MFLPAHGRPLRVQPFNNGVLGHALRWLLAQAALSQNAPHKDSRKAAGVCGLEKVAVFLLASPSRRPPALFARMATISGPPVDYSSIWI